MTILDRDWTIGLSITVGPWTPDGTSTVTASGPEEISALTAVLTGIVAAAVGEGSTQPWNRQTGDIGLSIRAGAPTVRELVAPLALDISEQLAGTHLQPATVRIDNILRTDEGLTAWGYCFATRGDRPAPSLPLVMTSGSADIAMAFTLTVTLKRA